MTTGFHLLIAAQFVSGWADNALLIVAIARLQELGLPGWWAPVLKVAFTLAYVVLAPFVGVWADAVPKGRLMAWMNALKWAAAASLLAGLHPAWSFLLAGFGAAAYSPAKYGLVTEIVPAPRLVVANAWIEVSTVCAALFGTASGGWLVSTMVRESAASAWLQSATRDWGLPWSSSLGLALAAVLALYALAAVFNLGLPRRDAVFAAEAVADVAGEPTAGAAAEFAGRPGGEGRSRRAAGAAGAAQLAHWLRGFRAAQRRLWADREGGLTLAVTTLCWGAGATLQFIVLRWAVEALGLTLDQSAYLQASVAVGLIAGAACAGRWVPLTAARRMLPVGLCLGLSVPCLLWMEQPWTAALWLAVVGALAGFFVVPMNALLQHRGVRLLSAGRSIAVQNFNENLGILAMLGGYAALTALALPLPLLMVLFGLGLALAMALLFERERRRDQAWGAPDAASEVAPLHSSLSPP
jgi:MFS family permease